MAAAQTSHVVSISHTDPAILLMAVKVESELIFKMFSLGSLAKFQNDAFFFIKQYNMIINTSNYSFRLNQNVT